MAKGGKFGARLRASKEIKIRLNIPKKLKDLIRGKSGNKEKLEAECEKAMSEAVKEAGIVKITADALNNEIAKLKGKTQKTKRRTTAKPQGPLVTTKHIDWKNAKKASGPVSATMNLGVTSGRAKDRVWAAAKLFYQIVANTPVDEDYEYTRQPKKSKEIKEKKAFRFVKGEDGLMKVVPVDVVKPAYKAQHKADDKVTRNNWVLKITTKKPFCELHSGSLGINFDQPSDTGWTAIADLIRARIGRYIPVTVDIENKDPYIDVLEYGRYNSTSKEKHQGAKYQHGTVSGYSVQAPRGIMRVAASQLNNLQLEANKDKDNKGVISEEMLSAIPKVTLKLNSDNLEDYAPVNEAVEESVRTAETNGEFVSERQIGEMFMSDKPSVDVVIKRSERAAKSANTRAFKKQTSTAAFAEALFKEVQKAAKVVSRQEQAENRALKEILKNQMSAAKAAGKLGSGLDKEVEKELKIMLKSQKTKISKTVNEKPVVKEKDTRREKVKPIEGTLFMVQVPDWIGKDDLLALKRPDGKILYADYKDSYTRKTEEEFRVFAAEKNIFKPKEEFFTKNQLAVGIRLRYSKLDEYSFK